MEKAFSELKNKNLIKDFKFLKPTIWLEADVEVYFDEKHNEFKQEHFSEDNNELKSIYNTLAISFTEKNIEESTPITIVTNDMIFEILEEYESIPLGNKKDFLTNVLEISINSQEIRRKNRLIAEVKFDVVKTFEGYCFDDIQLPEGLNLEEIKTGDFIEKSHNLIFYGSVGTGKTYLATVIGVEACNQGKRVRFFKVATLINELIDAYNKATLGRFLKNLNKV